MEFAIIIALTLINGLFALAEISFVTAKRDHLEELDSQGSKNARLVLTMMDEPDKFLSSIQVGITLIGIISGTFSGLALADDVSKIIDRIPFISQYSYQTALVLVVTIVTYLSIVIGELVPKTIGLRNPEKTILKMIPFVRTFSFVVHPVILFLSFSTKLILKIFRIKLSGIDEAQDPIKEILGIAKVAAIRNKIEKEQEQIISNAVNISNLTVKDIMVKIGEIRVLTTGMSLGDALVSAHIHHHTRYPLIDETNNGAIIGYVNFKDIVNTLRLNPTTPNLRGICRPVMYINEKDGLSELLRSLIRTHQHIAMVRNISGAVTGLVTIENMLETIVGDIQDEYDILPDFIYDIDKQRVLAGGGATLSRIREKVSSEIPNEEISICQWLISIAGTPLRVESKIYWKNIYFEIRKMGRSKIYEVIIDWSKKEQ